MTYHVVYPFNFFAKLPDLARQNLTRQIKLQDLILLSSCSKRCAMAIRISRVPPAIISCILKIDTIGICIPGSSFWWKFELGEFDPENIFKIKDIPVIISQEGILKTVLKKNLDTFRVHQLRRRISLWAGYNLCCAEGGPTRILTIGTLRCRTSHYIDTKDGLDILRDDGLLGTILKHYMSILFVVWHERFPERQPE
ncbi:hypothetical protein CAEBREN_14916 [Caenorhabditis brenneri]|uniref:F-box domain-containing protein n=1 Tax=Caenorhabditis brenneri TaxID=135651 RepID=G0N673_CAEBE|nr:hypothetical protein CAEBREN_14916 [Caenorhabditis brenneri]